MKCDRAEAFRSFKPYFLEGSVNLCIWALIIGGLIRFDYYAIVESGADVSFEKLMHDMFPLHCILIFCFLYGFLTAMRIPLLAFLDFIFGSYLEDKMVLKECDYTFRINGPGNKQFLDLFDEGTMYVYCDSDTKQNQKLYLSSGKYSEIELWKLQIEKSKVNVLYGRFSRVIIAVR